MQPKKISKEIQDVNLNIVGFKADLNDHSTISVHVFDYCSCPCVSVTSSLHNFCQRLACCKSGLAHRVKVWDAAVSLDDDPKVGVCQLALVFTVPS